MDSAISSSIEIKEGFKILVVEDHPTNQLVIGRQLQSLGFEYDMAGDGVEGLEKWKSNEFSLVLTDCHMPRMDGFELTREIRNIELKQNLDRVPIVAITANALVGEADTCLENGMDEYISKPVELKDLHSKLLRWAVADSKSSVHKNDEDKESTPDKEEGLDDSECIDISSLVGVIGTDDKEIISEILSMFWESVQSDFKLLKESLDLRDSEKIRSRAHAAKGSSASSGAIELSEIFKWIEKNNSQFEEIDSKVGLIDSQFVRIERQLVDMGVL
jgi:CheY-like chemotaxis protein